MKPFIKRKLFYERLAPKPMPSASFDPAELLNLDYLDSVSCFETLRAYDNQFFCLGEHIERLGESCKGFGRVFPIAPKLLENWLREALEESRYPNAMVRLSVHWKRGSSVEGQLVVLIRSFLGYPEALYQKGVDFVSSTHRRPSARSQDSQLKASQYVSGVLAMLDRVGTGSGVLSHELLFMGDNGGVAEGSVSNLFIVKQGCVLTPSSGSGILRGVTRSVVMALAKQCGYSVRETQLTRHELYGADECWMTNTSSELLPVVRIDERVIGSGEPGPITRHLLENFRNQIRRYLS